jgi:hypothetical protein
LARYAATDPGGQKLANQDQIAAGKEQRRSFEVRAEWDGEAGVWWCSNDELPLSTEAPTFEQLVS